MTDEEIIYEIIHGDKIDWSFCSGTAQEPYKLGSEHYCSYTLLLNDMPGPIRRAMFTYDTGTLILTLKISMPDKPASRYDTRGLFTCAEVESRELGADYIYLFRTVCHDVAALEERRRAAIAEATKQEQQKNDAAAREKIINLLTK